MYHFQAFVLALMFSSFAGMKIYIFETCTMFIIEIDILVVRITNSSVIRVVGVVNLNVGITIPTRIRIAFNSNLSVRIGVGSSIGNRSRIKISSDSDVHQY